MNGNIIDPMWFYWVKVLDNINGISLGAMVLGLVGVGVFFVFSNDCYDEKEEKMWRKRMKISLAILVLSALIIVFVPTSNTLIKMKLAEFGTYENVTTVIETIEQMADKIIDQME